MDRTERFYKIDQMLGSRGLVPRASFLEELGVSLATFKRDLEYLRNRLNAPIEWDGDAGGYRYSKAHQNGPAFSLPGMWFNASEAHALLMMQKLLSDIQPGLLSNHIAPLQTRLMSLLGSADHSAEEVGRRFRLIHAAKRILPLENFEVIASATLGRKKLRIVHINRQTGEEVDRVISPQQLVFYRDNWYVDAWCHLRDQIRSFSIDAIKQAETMDEPAKNVAQAKLKEYFEKGYGIFSGNNIHWAKLKFTPTRARWVSAEQWHPNQRSSFDKYGYYLLEVPYSDDRELVMDILRHGNEVAVLAPKQLKERIRAILKEALEQY